MALQFKFNSVNLLSLVLILTQDDRVILTQLLLSTCTLTRLRGQPVKPVWLVLNLNVRVSILYVYAQETVKYLVELTELWPFRWTFTPAVKHDVIPNKGNTVCQGNKPKRMMSHV